MRNFLLPLCILASSHLIAQSPYLLKDINQKGAPSRPQALVTLNSTSYFYANDGIHGRELWRSDGTESGTYLVKDISPGTNHSYPEDVFHGNNLMLPVGETLFTLVNDGIHGPKLWKSDGTEAGTVLVKDIASWGDSGVGYLTALDGKLFFSAEEELWMSDGTEAGTQMVEGNNAVFEGSRLPRSLAVHDGVLYYRASASDTYTGQLWKYDGTTTSMVYDVEPMNFTSSGGELFFIANDGIHGPEIWKTDGTTAGTGMLKDIYQGGADQVYPGSLIDVAGTLFFHHNGNELWKSDGTESGTVLVKDIRPSHDLWDPPQHLVSIGNTLYFLGLDDSYDIYLWKSDGTEAGTIKVEKTNGYYYPNSLTLVGATLYLASWDELWKSDGTSAGTVLVKDLSTSGNGGYVSSLSYSVDDDGELLMIADNGTDGDELWKSDGTEGGTAMVKNINSKGADSNIRDLTITDDQLFFKAGKYPTQLWSTNGSQTNEVSTSLSIDNYHEANNIASLGGKLLIAAESHENNYQTELYQFDPASGQFAIVKDINGDQSAIPNNFTVVDGTLFFTVWEEDRKTLWKTDGSEGGTVRVKDLRSSEGDDVYFNDFVSAGGKLFFSANDSQHGEELWVSDGTQAGTFMLKDIFQGTNHWGNPGGGYYGQLTGFHNEVYFYGYNGSNYDLWKSDGTAQGTVQVTFSNVVPEYMVATSHSLFFVGHNENSEEVIWKSNGTTNGTTIVKNVIEDQYESYSKLVAGGDLLYFVVDDNQHGRELWKSDGTGQGTRLVKDIHPSGDSEPEDMYFTNARLYFSANDGTHGRELWVSDGTEEGTRLAGDIHPGSLDSSPTNMIALKDQLIFTASSETGQELWAYDLTVTAPWSANRTVSVLQDSLLVFSSDDFAFSSLSNSSLAKVKVTIGAKQGQLFIDKNFNQIPDSDEILIAGSEIVAEDLDKLMFAPSSGKYGDPYASFAFRVSDGTVYSDEAYSMNIRVKKAAVITAFKTAQTITFAVLEDRLVGDTILLSATASSELAVSFSVEGPASLKGNTLVITGEGEIIITATQGGDDTFAAADAVVHRLQAIGGEMSTVEPEPEPEPVITGIEEGYNDKIVAYPNPTTGRVLLELGYAMGQHRKVRVTTAAGHLVSSTLVRTPSVTIDLSAYPAGLYLVCP